MFAARLQSAAFLRSSCTGATISFFGLGVQSGERWLSIDPLVLPA